MNDWPDLSASLTGIAWVVIGGVATRAYMPERQTKDLDVLIHKEDRERVLERLLKNAYQFKAELGIQGFTVIAPTQQEVDILYSDDAWVEQALSQPNRDAAGLPIIDLAFLVLMKLHVSRTQDLSDVSRMLGLASEEQLAKVRELIGRYAPADTEDLESLIALGKLELDESPKKSYNFDHLVGTWEGDALAEQKKLRNEWGD